MVRAPEYHERTKHATSDFPNPDLELDFETMPRPFKSLRDRPRESLPGVRAPVLPALSVVAEADADPLAGTEQTARDPVDAVTVASLCYYAAGIKAESAHPADEVAHPTYYRAASCTGNLHHIDAYVVCADLDGLDAGVYHFDPTTFSLDVLREGDYRGALADAAGPGAGVADAPVTVAVTSEWWRNAWKYRERTYRHAFWDSGTVVANLLGTAHAFDLPASVVTGFDDRSVADLLGVAPETEAPLELVSVGRGAPDGGPSANESPPVEPVEPETVAHPAHDRSHDLPYEAWAGSTLSDGESAAAWRDRVREAGSVGSVSPGDGERVPLAPVDYETEVARPLWNAIRRRRSCREFADEPLSRRKLGTVLDRATRGVPGDWNAGDASGLRFNDVYVLATDVEEVPDGSYQFHPEEEALERLGDATSRDQTRLALGQEWAGDAHVNVYCMTDVDAVVEELGDRGYRLAQLEAGVVLGRLYLATYAHRPLGGTGLTFFDDEVTEFLSPRAESQTPTTMFAMGVAE
ncbi:SagB/ThcOx family dehydrogenase [Halorussus aquaticus]|uniref:SagB/ThcOx family dehydrogenase n=1 Tax=Halorussus aquaticus TaxID=2953748 RepID=A0ABD5Q2D2_9EURY|nr:SagB/ThcOx family dehydrogenase [Halorussus aquaticus]